MRLTLCNRVVLGRAASSCALVGPHPTPRHNEERRVIYEVGKVIEATARLKPPREAAVAAEVATLAGGADVLARRATEVAEAGDLRLACQLVEWAATAAGDDPAVHEVRARVYEQRRMAETSLMAKGIFAGAVRESAPPADDG